jgi:hypothetical protein
MKIFKIISAVPMEHYKHQKGYDTVIEKEGVQIKVWMSEAQYQLAMFVQDHLSNFMLTKDLEKLFDLIEEFGQEKYCEGSNDEAMNNSEDI